MPFSEPGSPDRPELIIIGAGGAGAEAVWVARDMIASGLGSFGIAGFVDDSVAPGTSVEGFPVLGATAGVLAGRSSGNTVLHCAIGNNAVRARVTSAFEAAGFRFLTLVHPSVVIAPSATVGSGCYIAPLVMVGPSARIGNHVLINAHVSVGHHSVIEDCAQLSPGCRVNGHVRIGSRALVAANASIIPGITVEADAIVGANSAVIRTVRSGDTVIGVPAKVVFAGNRKGTTS